MEALLQVINLWLWLCRMVQGWARLPGCSSTVAWGLLFCLQQKQGARSCGAPSRGARRQGWPWRWGTGWLARRAGSQRMGAWTATALRESKQHLHCGFLTFLHEAGGCFSLKLVVREKYSTVSAVGPIQSEFPSHTSVIDGLSLSLPLWLKRVSQCWCRKEDGHFCCVMRWAHLGSDHHHEVCQEGKQVQYTK